MPAPRSPHPPGNRAAEGRVSATLSRLRQVRSNATERWLKFLEQNELGWELPPETPKRRATMTARLLGALLLIACLAVLNIVFRNSGFLLGVFSHLLSFGTVLMVLIGLFVSLPQRSTDWYWTVSGRSWVLRATPDFGRTR